MKRYNGKNGIPEMEEATNGHWVTYHDHNLAILDANKSSERQWVVDCCSDEKIRADIEAVYIKEIENQGNIITYLAIALFVVSSALLFLILG